MEKLRLSPTQSLAPGPSPLFGSPRPASLFQAAGHLQEGVVMETPGVESPEFYKSLFANLQASGWVTPAWGRLGWRAQVHLQGVHGFKKVK